MQKNHKSQKCSDQQHTCPLKTDVVCAAVIKRNKVNGKRRVQYNECQIYLCNIQKDFQQVTYPTGFERQKSHEGGKRVNRKVVHMHVQSSPLT